MARKAKEPAATHPVDDALTRAGWVPITGGNGEPWTEGMIVTGTFKGLEDSGFENDDGSMAQLVVIETAEGDRVLRAPTILANRLGRLHAGDEVRIMCRGKVKTSGGRRAWDFEVLAKPSQPLAAAVVVKRPGRPKGSRNKRAK